MNVYDFDETIYDGDSTVDLIFYLFKTYPKTLINSPLMLFSGALFLTKLMPKQAFKENVFKIFNYVEDMDKVIDEFTSKNLYKIKDWYKSQQKDDDLIISASPEFLISAFCEKIGIKYCMASPVDIKTGKYKGLNCHGEEKVKRYKEIYGEKEIDDFYSDSYSDTPLAKLSKKAYLVKGNKLLDWEK